MASPEETHDASVDPQADNDSQTTPPQAPPAVAPATGQARPPAAQRGGYVSREERDRRRREALAGLTVGEWREGKVTGIAAFGAFVDLGGVDGLVHVSQLGTGGYVERVEDVVQVGQVVRVRVVEVDTDRGRVSLSMREPRPSTPFQRDRPPVPRDRPAAAPPAPGAAPRTPRPAPAAPAPAWGEAAPEGRHDRRTRGGGDRPFSPRNDERPARRSERPRRRGEEDEEWRHVRGDPRSFYSIGDEEVDEPAPTTAEELVARFNRRDQNR